MPAAAGDETTSAPDDDALSLTDANLSAYAERYPAARQAARACRRTRHYNECAGRSASRRPATLEVSIHWRPACCPSAWVRRRKSPAMCSRGASAIASRSDSAPARRPAIPRAPSSKPRRCRPSTPPVIEAVRQRFLGQQTQIPPMYSALKRDGQPLYKLARAGVEVERAARDIELFELAVARLQARRTSSWRPCARRALTCGFWPRTSPRRSVRVGTSRRFDAFMSSHSKPSRWRRWSPIAEAREQGRWPRVLPADWPLGHLPKVSLTGAQYSRAHAGPAVLDGAERCRL